MDKDKLEHHIKHLTEQHEYIDRRIKNLELIGVFSDPQLEVLKKERLRLADDIEHTKKKLI